MILFKITPCVSMFNVKINSLHYIAEASVGSGCNLFTPCWGLFADMNGSLS